MLSLHQRLRQQFALFEQDQGQSILNTSRIHRSIEKKGKGTIRNIARIKDYMKMAIVKLKMRLPWLQMQLLQQENLPMDTKEQVVNNHTRNTCRKSIHQNAPLPSLLL